MAQWCGLSDSYIPRRIRNPVYLAFACECITLRLRRFRALVEQRDPQGVGAEALDCCSEFAHKFFNSGSCAGHPYSSRNFTVKLARFVRIGTIYTPAYGRRYFYAKNAKGGTQHGR